MMVDEGDFFQRKNYGQVLKKLEERSMAVITGLPPLISNKASDKNYIGIHRLI